LWRIWIVHCTASCIMLHAQLITWLLIITLRELNKYYHGLTPNNHILRFTHVSCILSCYNTHVNSYKPITMGIICNNRLIYTETGETNGHQYVFVFTMAKYCATKILVLPEGHQVFCGVYWHPYLLYISCLRTQINPPFFLVACSDSVSEHLGPLLRVFTRPIVNIVCWSPDQFSITNLVLLICGCMCTGHWDTYLDIRVGRVILINNIIIWLHLIDFNTYFIFYYLLCLLYASMTWVHDTFSGTYVLACARHLVLFYTFFFYFIFF